MFSRFFGQRNPEKDIERIVVDLHGANICRVIALAIGWKINEGATKRFLQHSTGFQLDEYGNARGSGAVDLQQLQDAVTQVASGNQSFIGAGGRNTVTGYGGATIGGYDNSVTDDNSVVLGGSDNVASGLDAGVIAGYENEAAELASVAMGSGAKTNTRHQMAHGRYRSNYGDSQVSRYVGSDTINMGASSIWFPINLGANGGVEIPIDTVMAFNALVVGTTQGCAKSFGYRIEGVVENDGGTTSVLGSTVTTLYEDDANFDCRAQADDPNDLLEIQVQDIGASSDVVAWTLRIDTAEVTYAA